MDLTWVEIKTQHILFNIKKYKELINNKEIYAVIKSNAYGHDMVQLAQFLDKNKLVDKFAVAYDKEALLLRKNNIKKQIFVVSFYNYNNADNLKKLINNNIELVVSNHKQYQAIDKISKKIRKKPKIHLKADVGTHRLGFTPDQVINLVKEIKKKAKIDLLSVFSHLADSESKDQIFTNTQIKTFNNLVKQVKEIDSELKFHIACSAATMVNKKFHFDAIRLGISLYGLKPSQHSLQKAKKINNKFNLKPVLSWHTRIIEIRDINKGDYIGYAKGFKAKKNMRIATIPVGYWDGYVRLLSNKAKVLINNKKCDQVGNICMNLSMIDISGLKNVKIGDRVNLLGDDYTADDMAKDSATINYEVVTRINQQIKRSYI